MHEFIISRTFSAPRSAVWKALTDQEEMKHWWGPKGAKVIHSKMDFRVGGICHYCFETPTGNIWGKFVYREIDAPKHLVFADSFSDEDGGITRHPLAPKWPLKMLTTFTLVEHGTTTTLTISLVPINPTNEERKTFEEAHDSMRKGWTGTLDQLTEYLRNDHDNLR